jgi:hypothetical protein
MHHVATVELFQAMGAVLQQLQPFEHLLVGFGFELPL